MMKIILNVLQIFCAIIIFSCTEKVDLDPRERAVVVHAILEDTTVQKVKLFYTSYVSENYNPPVEDAQVYIERVRQDSMVVERHDFYKVKDGEWEGDFLPIQNAIYKLTVLVPGEETITASTRFPLRNEFIRFKRIANASDDQYFHTKSSGKYNSEVIKLFSFMDYIPETKDYRIASSHMYRSYHQDLNTEESIFKEKYHTWMFQDFEYNGIYAINRDSLYISSIDSLNMTNQSYRRKVSVVLPGIDFNQIGAIQIWFSPHRSYKEGNIRCIHPLSYLVVQNISKDYEMYIKDIIAKSLSLNRKEESDLTHLWEKDEIYTNVKNGLGIFGAECRYELMVKDWQYLDYPAVWDQYNITIPGWND